MIIFDTCAWSLVMRRKPKSLSKKEKALMLELRDCMLDTSVYIHDCVRLEVLTGLKDKAQFEIAREYLRFHPTVELTVDTFERAAEMSNSCRAKGFSPGSVDILIVASAVLHDATIYTSDKDFAHIKRIIDFKLEGV